MYIRKISLARKKMEETMIFMEHALKNHYYTRYYQGPTTTKN
jgi:hypothetical protein